VPEEEISEEFRAVNEAVQVQVQVGQSMLPHGGISNALNEGALEAAMAEYKGTAPPDAVGGNVVYNQFPTSDPATNIISVGGIYQDWALLLGTKARNQVAFENDIKGDQKKELVKQSRRYKHNLAQVVTLTQPYLQP
jgi:hypothetical protein